MADFLVPFVPWDFSDFFDFFPVALEVTLPATLLFLDTLPLLNLASRADSPVAADALREGCGGG